MSIIAAATRVTTPPLAVRMKKSSFTWGRAGAAAAAARGGVTNTEQEAVEERGQRLLCTRPTPWGWEHRDARAFGYASSSFSALRRGVRWWGLLEEGAHADIGN